MIASKRAFAFDWWLFICTFLLLGLGLLVVGSATASLRAADPAMRGLVVRQTVFLSVGIVVLLVASLVNYRVWSSWRWLLYGVMLALLASVLVLGQAAFGASRWIRLSSLFDIQPAVIAKIVLIILLARYFADHQDQVRRGTGLVISFLLIAPFLVLIYQQPNLGITAVMVAIWLGMAFVAGMRLQHIIILMAIATLLVAPLLWTVMPSHAQERILMFLDPHTDPLGRDFNVIQALISVGSGGLWGKGLGQGSQTQLAFLRVRHTDFVFAVLAEELGFVGAMLLLALFALLLMRIFQVASRAADVYGRLVATGVGVMIFVHVVINISFHTGLGPVIGLPLPLISYGGSSLLTVLAGLGLVQSVSLYHQPQGTGT